MFAALARFVYRHRTAVVALFLVLVPTAMFLGRDVRRALKSGGFEDFSAESWRVREQLQERLGVGQADVILIYTNELGTADDPEHMAGVLGVVAKIEKDPQVVRIIDYHQTGAKQLLSKDGRRSLVVVSLRGDEQQKADWFHAREKDFVVDGLVVQPAGITPFNEALNGVLERDLTKAELIAFPITALLLVLIFGSLVSAALPLVLGGLAVLLAFAVLRALLLFTDASIFAANVISVLGLGLAIDYSLFILNRFREELPALGVEGAIVKAVSTTGRAVAFSGVTVAASLTGLFAFPQMFLRSMGLGGIVVVVGTVVLALTFLPALLGILGTRVDALKIPLLRPMGTPAPKGERSFWQVIAREVMKRPIVVAILVVVPLVILGVPFLRFDPSIPDYRILPADDPLRISSEILDGDFLAHQSTPHDLQLTTQGPTTTKENLERLWDLAARVEKIPGITKVESIFSLLPGGRAEDVANLTKPREQQDPQIQEVVDLFTKGSTMRMAAISRGAFNDQENLAQVTQLRALSGPELKVEVGGASAILLDLKDTIRRRAPVMVLLVAVVMFVVLFLVFGSVTLPFKAMIMNSLSLTASFGAIVWVFQDGRFQEQLGYVSFGFSEATQPLLMFAIVFGLSMDYEVLLLSRVREEYLRTGDNTASVAHGLEKTGRLITSAAALLVVVIGAFATSDILFMKTLGVGMALAIGLDATVVRALLVPAAMRLMGKWNWWAPAPLLALWTKLGMSDLEE